MKDIYLDNCATTRVHPQVAAAMMSVLREAYGNPSSAHRRGQAAEELVKKARRQVARVFRAKPEEILFTSGGTESNNWAVLETARARIRRGRRLVTTRVEHLSVLRVIQRLEAEGFTATYLPVDKYGQVDLAALAAALSPDTILVSIMHVNNEVGSIMPLADIAGLIKQKAPQAIWHVDAVQSFAKLPLYPHELGIDLVSISAHKIMGPKGVGALFVREGLNLPPLLVGGGQEAGSRSGTENVPGIVGLGLAAELLWERLTENSIHLARLKARLSQRVLAEIPDVCVNGPQDSNGAAHILNLSFPGLKGEVLLHALEDKGIYVATGAACSSRRPEGSHVLQALELETRRLNASIRFCFSPENTVEEIDYTADCLAEIVPKLRRIMMNKI
ncbi:MAG: cysteine desulfurase [Firmicutes bacterium]|nr:cysteine desulfurase [Bacillota bacterium]